jgi:acyl carrier protein
MISKDQLLGVIRQVSGKEQADMDSTFEALEMDSTNIVEVLIELEMVMDIDILDANVNLYELQTVADVYNYVDKLPG